MSSVVQAHPWPPVTRARVVAETLRRAILGFHLLPGKAALVYARANLQALRLGDRWSYWSTLPPRELAVLLELSRGRKCVVELGTGTGWTSIVLAAAERERVVLTYDTQVKPHRARYLSLADDESRRRIVMLDGRGEEADAPPEPVGLLYVDSNHDRAVVRRSFDHWREWIACGGFAAFDDYDNDNYPGVREAVAELGLEGRTAGRLFIWERTCTS